MTAPHLRDLDVDDVLRRVYLQVQVASGISDEAAASLRYARDVGAGLRELLVLDGPTTVRILHDDDVDLLGLPQLHAAALANVLSDPIEEHELVHLDGYVDVSVVRSSSGYLPSKLLVLPDLLRRTVGERPRPYGVLVAIPTSTQLLFSVIGESRLVTVATVIARYAAARFGEGVSAVSPYLYWWRDASLTQVSTLDAAGEVRLLDDPDFTALVQRLEG